MLRTTDVAISSTATSMAPSSSPALKPGKIEGNEWAERRSLTFYTQSMNLQGRPLRLLLQVLEIGVVALAAFEVGILHLGAVGFSAGG